VLERSDLRGRGGRLHLLAEACDLSLAFFDFELLGAAEGFFLEKRLGGFRKGYFRFGTGGLRGRDLHGGVGEFGAEAAKFEVLGLEDDEMFEIGVRSGLLSGEWLRKG